MVANHSLIGIHSMIKEGKILPKADVLVVDEAHALDSVLSEIIGTTISNTRFDSIMNRFLNFDKDDIPKSILSASLHLFKDIELLKSEVSSMWKALRIRHKNMELIKNLKGKGALVKSSSSIKSLIIKIKGSATGLFKEDQEIELIAALRRLERFADDLVAFGRKADGLVRWMEIKGDKTTFRLAPLYPRDFVLKKIVPKYKSLILTSATLSVANDFGYTARMLGLENSKTISLPSPYNMRQQVSPKLRRGIDLDTAEGIKKLAQTVLNEAYKKDGGILVLFTSREIMRKAWNLCFTDLKEHGFRPMLQGEIANKMIVDVMRNCTNSVVFGLDSFWEGVDIKGDSLKCLIITKLPFEVPSTPMPKARMLDMENKGENSFYKYLLPRAILKFKQGFGRLIRSESDIGRVIICDERIATEKYGSKFIKSVLS
ncbi:MAG: hypothetical protein M1353_10780 [Nitrospirae bacterium]|nr:hypothetical protein [Nitrospirota bacterium]